jgi:hypothetical protein
MGMIMDVCIYVDIIVWKFWRKLVRCVDGRYRYGKAEAGKTGLAATVCC